MRALAARALPLLLCAASGSCAAAPPTPWPEAYARAGAVELTGEWRSAAGVAQVDFRAAAPASGSLTLVRAQEFFGEHSVQRMRWIGDGTGIYQVNDEKGECAFAVSSWRELETLSGLPFLAPAWTLAAEDASAELRVESAPDGAIRAASGEDPSGPWSFTAAHSRVLRRADPADYAVALPAGYAVLGAPAGEFDHVRSLLAEGEYAPEITMVDLAGREHHLSEFRGKPVLLVFWFYH